MSGISINTNTLSLVLQSNLLQTTNALSKSMDRLSTGRKINSAADGAANLSISQKLQAQISGNVVAQDNVQQGKLMLNQADSSLQNINTNLAKIRDLAVKASNDSYSQEQRDAMAQEAQGYIDEINNSVKTTSFNGLTLLDGSLTEMKLQIGANSGDQLDIAKAFVDSGSTALGIGAGAIASAFSSAASANAFISTVDSAMTKTSSHLSTVGAYSNSLDSTLESLAVKGTNLEASNSTLVDVDYAKELLNYVQLQIKQQTTASLLGQANIMPSTLLSLISE